MMILILKKSISEPVFVENYNLHSATHFNQTETTHACKNKLQMSFVRSGPD